MRIAIAMSSIQQAACVDNDDPTTAGQADCFAKFEVHDEPEATTTEQDDDDTVQVTVVLRGKRGELENPALGVTELVLEALKAQSGGPGPRSARHRQVIDAIGIAVEPACAG
jgi:hypothetical protein